MKCPVCHEGTIVFDKGYPDTREEPGLPDMVYCDTCLADQDELEGHMVFNIADLAENIGCEIDRIARRIYKDTTCGCTFWHDENYVKIGGYAEGFDGDIEPNELIYPFTMDEFWEAVNDADEEGVRIWECVNEHGEDCECYLGYLD